MEGWVPHIRCDSRTGTAQGDCGLHETCSSHVKTMAAGWAEGHRDTKVYSQGSMTPWMWDGRGERATGDSQVSCLGVYMVDSILVNSRAIYQDEGQKTRWVGGKKGGDEF